MRKNKKNLSIKDSFSEFPGLRHSSISDKSGEEFYHTILNKEFKKALDENKILLIDLDQTAGYAPSFIDEAFGNLIFDFSLDIVMPNVEIISTQEPSWIDMVNNETYLQWEQRRIKNDSPKFTAEHESWYHRTSDGNIKLKK